MVLPATATAIETLRIRELRLGTVSNRGERISPADPPRYVTANYSIQPLIKLYSTERAALKFSVHRMSTPMTASVGYVLEL